MFQQRSQRSQSQRHHRETGGESGEIGGVGLEGGLIKGLFDGLEASLQTEHLFFFPQINEELPFSNEELQQLLRELSVGHL